MAATDSRVFLLERPRKAGLGSACVVGLTWGLARDYDCFFETDADFSHDPATCRRSSRSSSEAQVVHGSRNVPGGGGVGWGALRHLLSRGGSLYSRLVFGAPVHDMTAADLQRSSPSLAGRVRIQCRAPNVRCDLDTAVTLGLIVSEFVSNALEQAFVGKEQGVIDIDVSQRDGGMELRIEDGGASLPSSAVDTEGAPLSLRVVASLAQQLHAQLGVRSGGSGNSVRLTLPTSN